MKFKDWFNPFLAGVILAWVLIRERIKNAFGRKGKRCIKFLLILNSLSMDEWDQVINH